MSDDRFFEPYLFDKLAERVDKTSLARGSDHEEEWLLPAAYGFQNPAGMTLDEFERAVRRELKNLLNTKTSWPNLSLEIGARDARHLGAGLGTSQERTLADFPNAFRSVILCGLPDTTGMLEYTRDHQKLANLIRAAILTFEPRVDSSSVRVEAVAEPAQARTGTTSATSMTGWQRFRIEARILAEPVAEERVFWVEMNQTDGETRVR